MRQGPPPPEGLQGSGVPGPRFRTPPGPCAHSGPQRQAGEQPESAFCDTCACDCPASGPRDLYSVVLTVETERGHVWTLALRITALPALSTRTCWFEPSCKVLTWGFKSHCVWTHILPGWSFVTEIVWFLYTHILPFSFNQRAHEVRRSRRCLFKGG